MSSQRRARFENSVPRNWRWFSKELHLATKISANSPDFNSNANKWKWLYNFMTAIYLHRAGGRVLGISGALPAVQQWMVDTIQKVTGIPCVITTAESGNYCIIPRRFLKAYRAPGWVLQWVTVTHFEKLRTFGEILWCSDTKEWVYLSMIRRVFHLETGGVVAHINTARQDIFTCPHCQAVWRNAHKTPHHQTRTTVCPVCAPKKIQNKPHTLETVYGGYHSHKSSWKWIPEVTKKDSLLPIGVELEMQYKYYDTRDFHPHTEAMTLYQEQKKINKDWHLFYFERDGSLGDSGIEMITQPMSRAVHQQFWPAMFPSILAKFQGWNTEKFAPDCPYGIHLTFEVAKFGTFNLARLIKFVENANNKVLIQGIAQRGIIYGSSVAIAATTKKISQVVQLEKGKILGSLGRSQPIHVKERGVLCEVRMFRSTLNLESFMKNLEFLYAFHDWCGNSSFSADGNAFLEWLQKNIKTRYALYQNLYHYLSRDKFPVKLPKHPVTNPWASTFMPLVLTHQPGQIDMFAQEVTHSLEDYAQCA